MGSGLLDTQLYIKIRANSTSTDQVTENKRLSRNETGGLRSEGMSKDFALKTPFSAPRASGAALGGALAECQKIRTGAKSFDIPPRGPRRGSSGVLLAFFWAFLLDFIESYGPFLQAMVEVLAWMETGILLQSKIELS
jgi:hypothetical protein